MVENRYSEKKGVEMENVIPQLIAAYEQSAAAHDQLAASDRVIADVLRTIPIASDGKSNNDSADDPTSEPAA